MSLRDQLLAKGLASQKDARRVDAEAKRERKLAEGAKAKKRVEARAREAAEAAAREAQIAAKRAARIALLTERERMAQALQVRQIIQANRLKVDGPRRYAVRVARGARIVVLQVAESAAAALRRGDLGVVLDPGAPRGLSVLARSALVRLDAINPDVIAWWVRDIDGISAPDEAFFDRDWLADLRAHRRQPG